MHVPVNLQLIWDSSEIWKSKSVLICVIRGLYSCIFRVLSWPFVATPFAAGKKNPATGGIQYAEAFIKLFVFV